MNNEAQELNRIQIRSDEVQAILSYIPRWIIRWGITVIFVVVAMLVAMAWWIEYPDIVEGRVELTTKTLPKPVVALSNGKIMFLEVEKGDSIEVGDLVAVIESPTDYSSYQSLQQQMTDWELLSNKQYASIDPPTIRNLGELQQPYADLQQSISEYKDFLKLDAKAENVEVLKAEKATLENLKKKMNEDLEIANKDLNIKKKDLERFKKLQEEGIMSERELEQVEGEKLKQEAVIQSLHNQQERFNAQIAALETRIVNFKTDNRQQKLQLERNIRLAIERLQGRMKIWQTAYLIHAPITGQISMREETQVQKSVTVNEVLLDILPHDAGDTMAVVYLGMRDLGKVAEEQIVNIKLDSYPHTKYGLLKGKVKNIPTLPTKENLYRTEITLLNGLTTTFKDDSSIVFKPELSGTAEIITKDATILERVLEQFVELTQ